MFLFSCSSAGASSPAVPTNVGSIDWLGYGQSSKAASVSRIASRSVRPSLSTSAGGSALGSSQPSCRPWERGDLLRRLSTFNPLNWSGKPKVYLFLLSGCTILHDLFAKLALSGFFVIVLSFFFQNLIRVA